MRLALYQPDIPQNTGTLLRTAACLGIGVDIIEPCGFVLDDKRMRRAGMDYLDSVDLIRHLSWESFAAQLSGRLVLLTVKSSTPYIDTNYQADDVLMVGRESAGVHDEVHQRADQRVLVPMQPGMRSMNVAISGAMVLGEALRQTTGFPPFSLE